MLILLVACGETLDGAMDGIPARDYGAWKVEEGGRLTRDGVAVAESVLPELAFHGDRVVFPQDRGYGADLVMWEDGATRALTDWPGFEDRPAFSPDGRRVAFVSNKSGFAAVWVLDLTTHVSTQLTNVGLVRTPGRAPDGWVPVPGAGELRWEGDALRWGEQSVVVP